MRIDPADFTRLVEHNVLAVDGVGVMTPTTDMRYVSPVEHRPPARLLALVPANRDPSYAWNEEHHNCTECGGFSALYETMHGRPCRCRGTGVELLTVETECETYGESHVGGNPTTDKRCRGVALGTGSCDHEPRCDRGTRSLLVRLTGQPVPVYAADHELTVAWEKHIAKERHGEQWFIWHGPNIEAGENPSTGRYTWKMTPIDLGPDAQELVGRWVFLDCEVIQP